MKIAYLMGATVSGNANGVKSHAETWASGLRIEGHTVDLVSPWGNYDWRTYDIIHAFGFGVWLEIIPVIAARTSAKIVITPHIDANRSYFLQKLASYCGIGLLHMTSPLHSLRSVQNYISMYHVRSDYEKMYLINSFNVDPVRINKIPLSCRFSGKDYEPGLQREDFCLHVSILSSKNKNVERLMEAAIKYGFKLVLAGSPGTDRFHEKLLKVVSNYDNIEYLGFLSEERLVDLYSIAKVFALPSIFEGVGLVALEAGALGADVVLTNQGAPKEYYDGKAFLVDPYNIDDIGSTIVDVIARRSNQPELSNFIKSSYNNEYISKILQNSYQKLIEVVN